MISIRRLHLTWFPASVLLGMVLCWYLLHLIQNTPGRDINLNKKITDLPVLYDGSPDLRIVVLAYNRSKSLLRLLKSVALADYLGDKVALDIWIDRSVDGTVDNDTVKVAMNFKLKFGEKAVYVHNHHKGILKQWLETWNFKENLREICVFLEDDLTVSPYFYRWLKSVYRTYSSDDRISAFTLQGAGAIHSGEKALETIIVPDKHLTYLYSIPGTWGFSPKWKQWQEFIKWYGEMSKEKDFHPIILNDISTIWYTDNRKKGTLDNMWSMWFIYYNRVFKKYVLYPNIQPIFQGFSVNWKEPGMNRYGHDNKLVSGSLVVDWSNKYESLSSIPPIVLTNGTVIKELNTKIVV